jgi:uncharacterized protein (TIGR04551 family)
MRVHAPLTLLPIAVALLAAPQPAWSQMGRSSTSSPDYEQLKEQLREELREELKADLKSELSGEGGAGGPAKEDAWAEEEWKWEEPVKPELNFLELDGYFRFRYDLFKNLDLGTYHQATNTGPFSEVNAPPTPLCNTDPACAKKDADTLAGANMRLRLEPVLNVYEDIKIKMQWDILDNIVLGSTPDGFPKSPIVPLLAFSQSQIPPSDGVNALVDSLRVKRVWAEVGTPLGQLRFGRMPSHFGMGVLANEGRGLDSDFGDTNDRIMFATKIGDFYIVPAYDWTVSGPSSATRLAPQGQPFDRDQRDDVDQYILAVARRDKDQEIKEKLENDELVLNYGTYQVLRFQALDAANYYAGNDPNDMTANQKLVERDAQAWIYSLWFKLLWRKLSLEAEYVGILGNIGNRALAGDLDTRQADISINQHGGAFNAEYKFLRDALTLNLLLVIASGDRAPGWGVLPLSDASPQPGSWDGSQAIETEPSINNFRMDPDFQVDLILWRQLVGLVTDAIVVRPGVQYNLTEGFGARLDLVYSRAFFAESTPSAGKAALGLGSQDANLGIEADLKIFYDSEDGFHAWLQYGLLIPFGGLDRAVLDTDGVNKVLDAEVAQTIQAMLAISF